MNRKPTLGRVERVLVLVLLAPVITTCADRATGPSVPASMQIVAGDGQSTVVGTESLQQLVVKVLDAAQSPVANQIVNWRVVSGGGSVFAGAAITGADGIVRERWTLGTSTADSQRVEARAVDNATGAALTFAVFKATALPGQPASVTKAGGDAQTGPISAPLADSLAVRVVDQYGNPVPSVTVTWTISAGGGTVTPTTATNATGVAKARWTLGATLGANALAATVGSLSGSPIAFAATATPGAPAQLAFSGPATNVFVEGGPTLNVAIQDAVGNIVTTATTTVTVAIGANPVGGTLSGTTAVTAVTGVATFENLGLSKAGTGYTLTASAPGLPPITTGVFNVVAWASVSVGGVEPSGGVTRGGVSACGITTAGAAYCWGDNTMGQLGNGTWNSVPNTAPVAVSGGLTFTAVSTGSGFACGITVTGAAYCWGFNGQGNLGTGTSAGPQQCAGGRSCSMVPVAVAGGLAFSTVTVGGVAAFNNPPYVEASYACGVATGGAAYCWGGNSSSQLGTGTQVGSATPVPVTGGHTFATIDGGRWHTCGVSTGGTGYCWGSGAGGRLGTGPNDPEVNAHGGSAIPDPITGGLSFGTVSASNSTTCGLTTGGAAYCWGPLYLGDGNTSLSGSGQPTPQAVLGGLTFALVSASQHHICGVTLGGAAYCWGDDNLLFGDGSVVLTNYSTRPGPVAVAGGLTFVTLSTGEQASCGVTTAGAAYCWGFNEDGELGNGGTATGSVPARVRGVP